jgi:8-oxo-dGTP pyrophosphatase MutT (NUDIX family)
MAQSEKLRAEPDREPREQFAALPWRRDKDGDVEVLLITSGETRRWVIPTGWPIWSLTGPRTAEREAWEEAGVRGKVGTRKIGVYHYDKRLKSGRLQAVRVTVYGLEVREETADWPEKGQRERYWTSAWEAAPLVLEPELRALIAAFAP